MQRLPRFVVRQLVSLTDTKLPFVCAGQTACFFDGYETAVCMRRPDQFGDKGPEYRCATRWPARACTLYNVPTRRMQRHIHNSTKPMLIRKVQKSDSARARSNLVGFPGGIDSPFAKELVKASMVEGDKLDFAKGKGDDEVRREDRRRIES
eukprot:6195978-Pleurochrysis_carterae.AAC.1